MGVSPKGDEMKGPGEPVAVKIKLGWVLSEPLKFEGKSFNSPKDSTVNFLPHVRQEDEVHEAVIDDIRFTGTRCYVGLHGNYVMINCPLRMQTAL